MAYRDKPSAREIKAMRERLGLTQQEFAELLQVSMGAVRAWERGDRTPHGLYEKQIRALQKRIAEGSAKPVQSAVLSSLVE